jgi:hypothetical protein
VTATARKLAILSYNVLRLGVDYSDPGCPTMRNATVPAFYTPATVGKAVQRYLREIDPKNWTVP